MTDIPARTYFESFELIFPLNYVLSLDLAPATTQIIQETRTNQSFFREYDIQVGNWRPARN